MVPLRHGCDCVGGRATKTVVPLAVIPVRSKERPSPDAKRPFGPSVRGRDEHDGAVVGHGGDVLRHCRRARHRWPGWCRRPVLRRFARDGREDDGDKCRRRHARPSVHSYGYRCGTPHTARSGRPRCITRASAAPGSTISMNPNRHYPGDVLAGLEFGASIVTAGMPGRSGRQGGSVRIQSFATGTERHGTDERESESTHAPAQTHPRPRSSGERASVS